ncbi:hypothetical protein [Nocardia sp. NPDC020380]|uniref:hypothetical protein n=1 Tax=Nocardia sp. NPDC020380 TaxID=3364309 RepID=UPI003796EFE4
MSAVTASPYLAQHICAEISTVCAVERTARRNNRDGVYNIMVANGAAVDLARWCYQPGTLAMPRKRAAANEILEWTPPTTRFGHTQKKWMPEEDAILFDRPIKETAQLLGRTVQSVNLRRWRKRNGSV